MTGQTSIMIRHGGGASLRDRLLSRGWEFSFFQAVWLLERLAEGAAQVGGRGPVGREAIRFRPDVGMAFPATDVHAILPLSDPASGRTCYLVEVTFLGLYGASTPLPLRYAVDVLRSVEPPEPVLRETRPGEEPIPVVPGTSPVRAFLDLLHHRLISLFYRAWLKYRYPMTFGRPGQDVITDYLLYLLGLSPAVKAEELGVEPVRMIRYAGLLTQRPKSAAGLEGLLLDYWKGVPVRVEQCVGRWVTLKKEDQNRLGLGHSTPGLDMNLGEQVFDLSGQFRVVLGPVAWETYLAFLPDGRNFRETRSLVMLYQQDPLNFTLEVVLMENQVPPLEISSAPAAGRLGYTSWLMTAPVPRQAVEFAVPSAGAVAGAGGTGV